MTLYVLSSLACTQSYCAAVWPEVCLHHPPDAYGHALLMTSICVDHQNTQKQELIVQDKNQKVISEL